ncbi:hypothetical protein FOZ62_001365, partial [Perkinsus olseni]
MPTNSIVTYVDSFLAKGIAATTKDCGAYEASEDFEQGYRNLAVESNLLSGLYWLVSTKQLVSGYTPEETGDRIRPVVEKLLKKCYRNGGFASSPATRTPSVIATTSAMQLATIFGFDLSRQREEIVGWLRALMTSEDGVVQSGAAFEDVAGDIRFVYCVVLSLTLLSHQLSAPESRRLARWICRCQTAEGGFGQRPGCEAHAGHTFCAVATLELLNLTDGFDLDSCVKWLKRRVLSRGCNGRPGKPADSCYLFWVMGSLRMLGQISTHDRWLDTRGLTDFIESCFDEDVGGLAPNPDCPADPFHTHFGLAGLSIALGAGRVRLGTVEVELREFCTEKALVKSPTESAEEAFVSRPTPVTGRLNHADSTSSWTTEDYGDSDGICLNEAFPGGSLWYPGPGVLFELSCQRRYIAVRDDLALALGRVRALRAMSRGPGKCDIDEKSSRGTDTIGIRKMMTNSELQLNPDPPEALGRLKVEKWYKDQIRPVENDPGCEARYEEVSPELERALSETIVGGYRKHEHDETSAGGHLKLYTHQIRALEAIALEDRNVCICTATSSGKSLAFNLPILSYIDKHPDATALYLYPTKALAQDQLRVLKQLVEATDIVVTTLDGDCDTTAREVARSRAQRLLGNLKFVVVDECHTYRGSFGSHVANVVRRLRRAFDWHQNKRVATERRDLRFICCSATIGNPSELMANLTGLSTTTVPSDVVNGITTIGVDADGAPRGPRWVVIWRPSDYSEKNAGKAATEDAVKDKVTAHILNTAAGLGQETSAGFVADTSKLMATLVQMGVRTICFARYRQMVEIMLSRVVSYRSGYTQESRRDIEQQIFSHKVLGVICTSALELGVDIGSLDCCISMGYPGSSHSVQQQFGRAGRSGRASLCILVTRETDPIDQWFSAQPERLMETLGQAEDAPVQWDNEQILPKHLLCADNEVEFRSTEDVAEYAGSENGDGST